MIQWPSYKSFGTLFFRTPKRPKMGKKVCIIAHSGGVISGPVTIWPDISLTYQGSPQQATGLIWTKNDTFCTLTEHARNFAKKASSVLGALKIGVIMPEKLLRGSHVTQVSSTKISDHYFSGATGPLKTVDNSLWFWVPGGCFGTRHIFSPYLHPDLPVTKEGCTPSFITKESVTIHLLGH